MTMEHIGRSFAVTLHILHPSMDPAEITRTVELDPWRAKQAGPPREPPFDQAVWSHRFDCDGVLDLVPFLQKIVLSLQAHKDFFRLVIAEGGSIELFCGIYMESNWDEVFPSAFCALLSELGIDLRLDAYPQDHANA